MDGERRVDADILKQDVNDLADAHLDLWRELDGCRILITTGFVGSFILHLITALCRRHGLHIHVLALVRSRKRLREVLGDDREGSWLQVVEQDLRAPLSLKNEGPIVLHPCRQQCRSRGLSIRFLGNHDDQCGWD